MRSIVDIAKSEDRGIVCQESSPTVLPNSKMYRLDNRACASSIELLALQGVWAADFPSLQDEAPEHSRAPKASISIPRPNARLHPP